MYTTATISGQKYKAEAKYINQTKSEWYVPPVTDAMTFEMMNQYKKKLEDQVAMWESYYSGANKKEARNLDIILEVQGAKLEAYISAIEKKAPAGGGYMDPAPIETPGAEPPAKIPDPVTTPKNNLPLIIGAGLLVILFLKK